MLDRIVSVYEKHKGKFSESEIKGGALYIVSTPIGNLEDISFRAVHILRNVDLVACEDTRVTNFLLQQYDINNKTISYYSNVERSKLEFFINELKSGKSVSLVSDAGTPGISDPGNILISECIKENIEVVSVPGCSSLIHALVLSGFSLKRFYFQGFLPLKKGRMTLLNELKEIKMSIVIFESPFRITRTLKDIYETFGNREISLSRELTKKFEEVIRGKLSDIMKRNIKLKGEFVIIVNNS